MKIPTALICSTLILSLSACGNGTSRLPGSTILTGTGKLETFTVSADNLNTVAGAKVKLTGVFTGTGDYSHNVDWKVISGPGKVEDSSSSEITYFAPKSIDNDSNIVIEGTPRADASKVAKITLNMAATTTIRVYAFEDLNFNGVFDGDEKPIVGAKVSLKDATNALVSNGETDAKGELVFLGLKPKEYRVTEEIPSGYGLYGVANPSSIASQRLPLTTGPEYLELGFANTLSEVRGMVYLDDDQNARRTPKIVNGGQVYQDGKPVYLEDGVSGVSVRITGTDSAGKAVDQTVKTDGSGMFRLSSLLAGNYTLTEVQPPTLADADDRNGSPKITVINHNGNIDDPNYRNDTTNPFDLGRGELISGLEFGESNKAVIGWVFYDQDRDGYSKDPNDKPEDKEGIKDVKLELKKGATVVGTTRSQKNGEFIFDRFVPYGSYTIEETTPLGYGQGHTLVNEVFADSNLRPVSVVGDKANINVRPDIATPETEISDTLSSISGSVFLDDNNDGVRDLLEPGLVLNVPIRLTGTDALGKTVNVTARIGVGGYFYFDHLLSGTYTLDRFQQPSGYQNGKSGVGLIGALPVGTIAGTQITNIVLPTDSDGVNYTFGQLPL